MNAKVYLQQIFHSKTAPQKNNIHVHRSSSKNQTLTLAIFQQLLEFFKQIFKITDFTFHPKYSFLTYLLPKSLLTYSPHYLLIVILVNILCIWQSKRGVSVVQFNGKSLTQVGLTLALAL